MASSMAVSSEASWAEMDPSTDAAELAAMMLEKSKLSNNSDVPKNINATLIQNEDGRVIIEFNNIQSKRLFLVVHSAKNLNVFVKNGRFETWIKKIYDNYNRLLNTDKKEKYNKENRSKECISEIQNKNISDDDKIKEIQKISSLLYKSNTILFDDNTIKYRITERGSITLEGFTRRPINLYYHSWIRFIEYFTSGKFDEFIKIYKGPTNHRSKSRGGYRGGYHKGGYRGRSHTGYKMNNSSDSE